MKLSYVFLTASIHTYSTQQNRLISNTNYLIKVPDRTIIKLLSLKWLLLWQVTGEAVVGALWLDRCYSPMSDRYEVSERWPVTGPSSSWMFPWTREEETCSRLKDQQQSSTEPNILLSEKKMKKKRRKRRSAPQLPQSSASPPRTFERRKQLSLFKESQHVLKHLYTEVSNVWANSHGRCLIQSTDQRQSGSLEEPYSTLDTFNPVLYLSSLLGTCSLLEYFCCMLLYTSTAPHFVLTALVMSYFTDLGFTYRIYKTCCTGSLALQYKVAQSHVKQ